MSLIAHVTMSNLKKNCHAKVSFKNGNHCLLPTGREEREVLGFGSIPVAILPSCQYMKMLYHNCIGMNIVGW